MIPPSAAHKFAAQRKFVFTERRLAALKPTAKLYCCWDRALPGFALRVNPGGSRSFVAVAPLGRGGRMVWVTLGQFPTMMVEAARQAARVSLLALAAGSHPRELAEARQRAEARRAADTVAAVVERHLALHVSRLRRRRDRESILRRQIVRRWGERPISAVERRDVVQMLDEMRGEPEAARKALMALKSLYSWAIERDLVSVSPASGVRADRMVGPAKSRDRVLSDEEIRRVWRASFGLPGAGGAYIRILLLTGLRRNELARLTWTEINWQKGRLVIPASRMKGAHEHVLPVGGAVLAELAALPRRNEFVFAVDARPLAAFGEFKAKLDRLIGEPALDNWRLHDVRRTLRTKLSELRVPPLTAELVLAHKPGGVFSIYDRHDHLGEMRAALEALERHLFEEILGERRSVVALPRS
jgi:integrase